MRLKTILPGLIVSTLLLAVSGGAGLLGATEPEHAIRIDVPVVLKNPRVVFNLDRPVFSGDLPVGFRYMGLLAKRLKELNTDGDIVGLLYGETAYLTLNDQAYNAFRQVDTGNPYKGTIADLQKQGVRIEGCAYSMKVHHWGNADLLPGVKVNTGAVGRLIQLVQDGYVQIQP
jgi:intracellular sulfur oxidation DsrE/DsrF family protein